jgi:hypothetical protein
VGKQQRGRGRGCTTEKQRGLGVHGAAARVCLCSNDTFTIWLVPPQLAWILGPEATPQTQHVAGEQTCRLQQVHTTCMPVSTVQGGGDGCRVHKLKHASVCQCHTYALRVMIQKSSQHKVRVLLTDTARWQSRKMLLCFLRAATTGGPMVKLGAKVPAATATSDRITL